MSGIQLHHVNITAKDVKKITDFYVNVFGCRVLVEGLQFGPDPKDDIGRVSRQPAGVTISGSMLEFPPLVEGQKGTRFEILSFSGGGETHKLRTNDYGINHLCFTMDDLEGVLKRLLENGGELYSILHDDLSEMEAVFAYDPEGNMLELHRPL